MVGRWVVVGLVLVVAACTGGGVATTTSSSSTTTTTVAPTTTTTTTFPESPRPVGGEVVIGVVEEPSVTLNPFVPGGDDDVVGVIAGATETGVQDVDGFTLELVPEVVTELPSVANGGFVVNDDGTMTVSYTIRDEAVWSDGTPISGDDFLFTYETIMDPDLPIIKLVYEDIIPESVVAGPKSFEFTLSAPTVQAELLFGSLIPKHAVEGSDFLGDWNDVRWPAGGPFVFDEWVPGEFVRLVRNDNYWKTDPLTGQQLPYLDAVTFRFVGESELVEAFAGREVDVVNPPPVVEVIEELSGLEGDGAVVEVLSGPIWEHVNFQFGPGRFERNPNSCTESATFRRAVVHAIDKSLIVDELFGGQVEPLDSYVTAFAPTLSRDAWAQYDYDPVAAGELYADAVAETGKECTIVFTTFTTPSDDTRVLLAELMATMFTEAGIPYENDIQDSQLFYGRTLSDGTLDVGEWAWEVSSPGFSGAVGIHDVFDPEGSLPNGSNFYRWGTEDSAVIDDATERFAEVRDLMNQTVDETELTALINEAEQILADNLVIIPLYAWLDPGAVWADEISGYKHNPTTAGDTWNIETWWRVDLLTAL